VIDLKGRVNAPTVHALSPTFLQQIRADFPPDEFSSLIANAREFRVLEQLHVELDALDIDAFHRHPALILSGPGEHIANARTERGREPPRLATTIAKAWSPIPQVGRTPAPAMACALAQQIPHLLPAMPQFRQVQRVMNFSLTCLFYSRQRQARRFRAWIDLEDYRPRAYSAPRFGLSAEW
jgi:hypothetical protein